jgi:hypothetical protein
MTKLKDALVAFMAKLVMSLTNQVPTVRTGSNLFSSAGERQVEKGGEATDAVLQLAE